MQRRNSPPSASPTVTDAEKKSISIEFMALLKSVIEAGHPSDQWESLAYQAYCVHFSLVSRRVNVLNESLAQRRAELEGQS